MDAFLIFCESKDNSTLLFLRRWAAVSKILWIFILIFVFKAYMLDTFICIYPCCGLEYVLRVTQHLPMKSHTSIGSLALNSAVNCVSNYFLIECNFHKNRYDSNYCDHCKHI